MFPEVKTSYSFPARALSHNGSPKLLKPAILLSTGEPRKGWLRGLISKLLSSLFFIFGNCKGRIRCWFGWLFFRGQGSDNLMGGVDRIPWEVADGWMKIDPRDDRKSLLSGMSVRSPEGKVEGCLPLELATEANQ